MLTLWHEPSTNEIAERCTDFLCNLPGPVAIHQQGRDTSRCRVLVTLSHGNEPSGLEAVHGWLLSGRRPEVNIVIILGSVAAAMTDPLFFHRMLPGQRDLNRCFDPPYTDGQGQLALAIMEHIRAQEPEAVIDLHNTSGSSPAFAVALGESAAYTSLVSLFVDRLIVTDLRFGSLMEQELGCAVVTIEAGGSQDNEADVVASEGLVRYFTQQDIYKPCAQMTTYHHSMRLELAPHSRIDYAQEALHDRDITVRSDIEHFNFAPIEAGEMVAWAGPDGLAHLRVRAQGNDHPVQDYFHLQAGTLCAARRMRLFMATTRPDIAVSDCLFYFVCEP